MDLREDGREAGEERTIVVESGKAMRLEQGNTIVLSTLSWGPSANKRKGLAVRVVFLASTFQGAVVMERKRDEYERYVEGIFNEVAVAVGEAKIEITHRVLEDDGSLLSVLVNATSLVLSKSSVPMMYLVFSVKCGLAHPKKRILADLNLREEKKKLPALTIAAPYKKSSILFSLLENKTGLGDIGDLVMFSSEAVERIGNKLLPFIKGDK
jgi:ribonuclease PH